MNDLSLTSPRAIRPQTLWAAIGVLGVAVLALGSTLYYVQTRPPIVHEAAMSPVPEVAPVIAAPATAEPVKPEPSSTSAASEKKPKTSPKAVATSNRVAATSHKPPVAAPLPQEAEQRVPERLPPKVICVNCATVTAVTPLEREGAPSGAGAVAGGVLGALVGNQFGGGDGKAVATILGAVGGGLAGNTVEKKMKKVTAYQVELRMDDGSVRSLEQATPVSVGARVQVDGHSLQPLISAP